MRKETEVVAALIREADRFLICQRPADKARALQWEFVGGKVEPGETREQALIRECREELGVTLSVGEAFMEVTHDYPDITIHMTVFHAVIARGTPQKMEHTDLPWVRPAATADFDFCPADRGIVAKIQQELP